MVSDPSKNILPDGGIWTTLKEGFKGILKQDAEFWNGLNGL